MSWGYVGMVEYVCNFGGVIGVNIVNLLCYIFGLVVYVFLLLLLVLGV